MNNIGKSQKQESSNNVDKKSNPSPGAFKEELYEISDLINTNQRFLYRLNLNGERSILYRDVKIKYLKPLLSGGLDHHPFGSFHHLIFDDDQEIRIQTIENAIKNKSAFEIYYRVITNGNNLRILFERGSVITNTENIPEYIDGVVYDDTDRLLVEQKLQEKERQLSTLISNFPGMVYRCINDSNWTMKFVSDGCLQLTGYSPEDLIDNNKLAFNDLIDEQYQSLLWNKWQDLLQKHDVFQHEYIIKTASGEKKWVWEQGRGVYNEDNEVIALEGVIIDITYKKIAEIQLIESHNQLQKLFDLAPVAILLLNKEIKVIDSNKKACDLLGYSKDEFLSLTIFDIDYNINEMKSQENWTQFPRYFESIHKKKDGSLVEVFVSLGLIPYLGDTVIISFIHDISERKKSDKIIRAKTKELEELNSTKDKFFSIIAHDLKSPFNAILGFADLLYSEYDLLNEAEKRSYIHNIRMAADRSFKLLENLLDWSRIQTNRISFYPETSDLSVMIKDVLYNIKAFAETKQIKIITSIDHNTQVFCDRNMIKTVLRNLVSNSVKFSYPESEIKISAATISKNNSEYCLVTITDSGVGIHPDIIPKLFLVGEKIQSSGTADEKGTGLGLILCHEFVERNKGKIWAESTYGAGSRFYFTLPMLP